MVLMLDTSASMAKHNGLDVAKEAGAAVIGTLGPADWFNVVAFAGSITTATVSFAPELVRATAANKTLAIEFINDLPARGGADIEAAFDEAFRMLNNSVVGVDGVSRGYTVGTPCRSSILFLMDGNDHVQGGVTQVADHVVQLNQRMNHTVQILTCVPRRSCGDPPCAPLTSTTPWALFAVRRYALGNDGDGQALSERLACNSSGLWQVLDDSKDVREAMAHYYEFLAVGLDLLTPSWSELYLDATTGEQVYTCSVPAVVIDGNYHTTLIGVVGVNVGLHEFKCVACLQSVLHNVSTRLTRAHRGVCSMSTAEVTRTLQQRSRQCSSKKPTLCQLEMFRKSVVGHTCGATLPPSCNPAPPGE